MSNTKQRFFISTAIDYPSEPGHLGHALEKIQADVIARYKRLQGYEVHFSIGTDEHGLKIQQYAQKAGKKPQNFVDEMSGYFKDLWKILNISNDDFIRTTEERHIKVVREIIRKIYKKGDIYEGKYKGFYCVDCESYYLPKDLEGEKCPVHHKPIETIEEETYFFRMGKYQKQLLEYIKENRNFVIPESKRKEILNRLQEPLQDLSISRKNVEWGIPLPYDEKFTLFVWIDALINYLTTIGYPDDKFTKFWPADVHVIGKDIVWHHTAIWGSLLFSAGLPLPRTIFVHGFISVEGQKMSKSLGNVINPVELVEKYGVDPVRYYLMREFSPTEDGDYSRKKFEQRYNTDLANGLGNLVSRVLALAAKTNHKPQITNFKQIPNLEFQTIIKKSWGQYDKSLNEFRFNEALESVWSLMAFCDEYISKEKPWEDKKESPFSVYCLLLSLCNIAHMLRPFLPETSDKIFAQLGIDPGRNVPWGEQGFKIKKEEALFPRLPHQ